MTNRVHKLTTHSYMIEQYDAEGTASEETQIINFAKKPMVNSKNELILGEEGVTAIQVLETVLMFLGTAGKRDTRHYNAKECIKGAIYELQPKRKDNE